MLRAYEAIVRTFADAKGKVYRIDGPFFVNADLKQWIGTHGERSINYGEFVKAAGINYFRSHWCRNMFATALGASTSLILRESAGNPFRTL